MLKFMSASVTAQPAKSEFVYLNNATVRSQLTLTYQTLLLHLISTATCVFIIFWRGRKSRIHSLEGTFLLGAVLICSRGHPFRNTFITFGKLQR